MWIALGRFRAKNPSLKPSKEIGVGNSHQGKAGDNPLLRRERPPAENVSMSSSPDRKNASSPKPALHRAFEIGFEEVMDNIAEQFPDCQAVIKPGNLEAFTSKVAVAEHPSLLFWAPIRQSAKPAALSFQI